MVIKKIAMLCLLIQFICINKAQANVITDEVVIKDACCAVKPFDKNSADNKKASLLLKMTLKQHASGVAYGVGFELFNNSNRNLVIRAPSLIHEMFKIVILNDRREEISEKLKTYSMDGAEKREYKAFTLQAGEKKSWIINFKDVLQKSDVVKKQLTSDSQELLMMFFRISYFVDGNGCDKQYKDDKFGKYFENVRFSLESYLPAN
ncbi:hypothetical protein [Methylovulum sp.]|uniref:hypothetical protein n=1 Tax=Methylovulum sp. TaxID=1916980 RepID=UPI0026107566|nr:hypothetical protein [Methylovulum sp.]